MSPGCVPRPLICAILAILAAGPTGPARAQVPGEMRVGAQHLLEGWSFAVAGGVQTWDLATLEDVTELRAQSLSTTGFRLETQAFGATPAVGGELAYHFGGAWLVRLHGEWMRFKVTDRSSRAVPELGDGFNQVSVGYETTVQANPLVGTLGLQRTFIYKGAAISLGGGAVFVPVKVTDSVENWVEGQSAEAQQIIESSGFGVGLDLTATVDYLLGGSSTLYLEGFYRNGSSTAETDDPALSGSFVPTKREVEFSGVGLRLGMRFN